jgi:photosystem II stability/assembly factor-like uncharacterized protein
MKRQSRLPVWLAGLVSRGRMRWKSGVVWATSLLAVALLHPGASLAQTVPVWVATGPAPNKRGQVENVNPDGEVIGAIHAVAPHPTDPNTVYVGSVNGGVWKSQNATAAHPHWTVLTDTQASLSIGALEFDPADSTLSTLVAGIGRFSSLSGTGGIRSGLLRTTDGGATWTAIDGSGALSGVNVSGLAPRGSRIVLSANTADDPANSGIWRSTDTGSTWSHISGASGSGLPAGDCFDLAWDPNQLDRLYTAGQMGVFRSDDGGATWTKVSSAAMDALAGQSGNIKVAVGRSDNVYVAIVVSGALSGLFRTGDGSRTTPPPAWTKLDNPETTENAGARFGIHPGNQGDIHLALAAEPADPNVVYVAGDRQPCFTESNGCNQPSVPAFPNSIGANDFSGRIFRVDASKPAGAQFTHVTHGNTAGRSSPHADSRDMDVTSGGALLLGCDGGVYRQTSPRTNTGDWVSMNGDLQTSEFHAVAWDSNTHTVIGGAQDTGSPEQLTPNNVAWQSVSTGDGGVVAVDAASTPGLSTRYTSFFNFNNFRRQIYNSAGVFQSEVFPQLTVLNGGAALDPQFYTPIRLNTVTPTRLVIGAQNAVYESLDQGDTISEIGSGIAVNGSGPNPIAYGAAGNAEMLYVGSGSRVFVRTAADPAPLTRSAAYTGGFVTGIAIDPANPQTAYVVDPDSVYRTTDAGGHWTDITGNLGTLNPGALQSVAYSTEAPASVVVGSMTGAFHASGPAFNNWSALGSGLPKAPVYHLEYNPRDRVLLAGTLGRGAWKIDFANPAPPVPPGAPVPPAPPKAAEGGPGGAGPS